jgi:hypothetical protein
LGRIANAVPSSDGIGFIGAEACVSCFKPVYLLVAGCAERERSC